MNATILLSAFTMLANSYCILAAEQVSMGTTIFAVKFRDGVVVGADSRTSVSGYVSNRYATKISFVLEDDFGLKLNRPSAVQSKSSLLDANQKQMLKKQHDDRDDEDEAEMVAPPPVSSTCCICRSGSAADTQYIADVVRHQLLTRKVMSHTSSSISNVAHLLKNYLYNNELQASLICAGYDHVRDEGVIYNIDLGGTMMEQDDFACNGSGSGYILGHIDKFINARNGDFSCSTMSEEEAIEFVGSSIELAMDRDGSSGGVVRLFVINRNGKREMLRTPEKYDVQQKTGGMPSNLSQFAPAVR